LAIFVVFAGLLVEVFEVEDFEPEALASFFI
jgi:hypothetical protein